MSLSSKDDFGKLQDSLTYALGQQHQTNNGQLSIEKWTKALGRDRVKCVGPPDFTESMNSPKFNIAIFFAKKCNFLDVGNG